MSESESPATPLTLPETMPREDIERVQLAKLQRLVGEVAEANPFWQSRLVAAGVSGSDVRSLDDLRRLPIVTKAELVDDQAAHPPYGTNLTYPLARYARMHQTSGTTGTPMRWLDTLESWEWTKTCWAQIFRVIGLTPEDRLYFPFSFGPFLGFWSAFDGASTLGNLCLPGGGLSSQARLQAIVDHSATIVCCTPTYALRLADVAAEQGLDLARGSVRALVVAGEPGGSVGAIRRRIEQSWGARVFDHWGMTELGPLGIECVENPAGLHLLETECIAEVVDPESLEPVAAGTQGELLITNLGRLGSPLIRYRTGDLVCCDPQPCACGRQLLRLEGGILGRADDMITIRGNNVFPSSIEAVLREIPEVAEFRIEVLERRAMNHVRLVIEPVDEPSERLAERIRQAIKDRLQFQTEVDFVGHGQLPRFELKARRFFRM